MTIARRLLGVVALLLAVPATSAHASMLIQRDVRSTPRLAVNAHGIAMLTYVEPGGKRRHTLVWGALNGSAEFQIDRSGGWKSHVADWKHFRNACRRYTGPHLAYRVAACDAPDGSHWAIQQWRRVQSPGASVTTGARELRVSHWTGPLARMWVKADWSWHGRYRHMYGTLTYRGHPVYGHCHTSAGYVCDKVGRNVFLSTLDSELGRGWHSIMGFLASPPSGEFCYGFNRKPGRPWLGLSRRNRYRVSVPGPGVSPDIVTGFALRTGRYDAGIDGAANAEQRRLVGSQTHVNCFPIN